MNTLWSLIRLNRHLILNSSFLSFVKKIGKYKAISLISGYHFNESKKEFSCGFSFKYRKLQFDYGIALNTILGNPTILSIKYKI